MKFIYMATADIAVKPLIKLIEAGHTPICVVTQPDKPNSRRGGKIIFNPVKQAALDNNIEVYQPVKVSSEESEKYLRSLGADIIVVCAFGQLLKNNILTLTKYGCINLHASLLPKYRGAAPINRAIMDGEKITGVTVMYMDEGLDTGDMMIKKEVEITGDMNAEGLTEALSQAASELICEAFELLVKGNAPREKQNEDDSNYAAKITKEECEIDFNKTNIEVFNFIRGLSPVPGAKTHFEGKTVKIFEVKLNEENFSEDIHSGSVVKVIKDKEDNYGGGLVVKCGVGSVIIKTLQPEGKACMKALDFYNGLRGKSIIFGGNN